MRAIVIGSELISLSTAYHLSQIGYEVTLIEAQTKIDAAQSKNTLDVQLFRQELESKVRESGVNIRYACKAERVMTQGNRVRGVVIKNENNETETLMADRFVAGLDNKGNALLKTIGVMSPAHLKPFNSEHSHNPLIGKSRYTNLFLNIGYSSVSPTVVSQTAQMLANFIYNPSLDTEEQSVVQSIQAGLSALVNVFSPLGRLFA